MTQDRSLLIARALLSTVFLYSGLDKALGWNRGVVEVGRLGVPIPEVALALTIATQLFGGLAVLTGIGPRIGSGLLATFTVVATLLAHWPAGLTGEALRAQLTTSLEHLAIVGGFVALTAVGPGALTLPALIETVGRRREDA